MKIHSAFEVPDWNYKSMGATYTMGCRQIVLSFLGGNR